MKRKQLKLLAFGVFGLSCKAAFHLIALVATYYHCKTVFAVLVCILAAHNIVSWLCREMVLEAHKRQTIIGG